MTTGPAPGAPRPLQPLVFDCAGERLLGLLHPAGGRLGLVIVVGGPQYRAGSHRHFVTVAEAAAAAGHPTLRFDVRGMGDSTGALRQFEQIGPDIGAAIDALVAAQPQLEQVVLWGLCDGASAALIYLHERHDPRVAGLCLLNPWVRSTTSQARAQVKHYYVQRLMSADFWRKLLSGGVAAGALGEFLGKLRAARQGGTSAPADAPLTFQGRMLAGWQRFDGSVLLALSGEDYTATEFIEFTRDQPTWQAVLDQPTVTRLDLPEADHTLSCGDDAQALDHALLAWLARLPARTMASAIGHGPARSAAAGRATRPAAR